MLLKKLNKNILKYVSFNFVTYRSTLFTLSQTHRKSDQQSNQSDRSGEYYQPRPDIGRQAGLVQLLENCV